MKTSMRCCAIVVVHLSGLRRLVLVVRALRYLEARLHAISYVSSHSVVHSAHHGITISNR